MKVGNNLFDSSLGRKDDSSKFMRRKENFLGVKFFP
ncbi:hypothetical protein QE439_002807 [Pedobacter agri]|nr:hypothetical protein [Pedobacter agri]